MVAGIEAFFRTDQDIANTALAAMWFVRVEEYVPFNREAWEEEVGYLGSFKMVDAEWPEEEPSRVWQLEDLRRRRRNAYEVMGSYFVTEDGKLRMNPLTGLMQYCKQAEVGTDLMGTIEEYRGRMQRALMYISGLRMNDDVKSYLRTAVSGETNEYRVQLLDEVFVRLERLGMDESVKSGEQEANEDWNTWMPMRQAAILEGMAEWYGVAEQLIRGGLSRKQKLFYEERLEAYKLSVDEVVRMQVGWVANLIGGQQVIQNLRDWGWINQAEWFKGQQEKLLTAVNDGYDGEQLPGLVETLRKVQGLAVRWAKWFEEQAQSLAMQAIQYPQKLLPFCAALDELRQVKYEVEEGWKTNNQEGTKGKRLLGRRNRVQFDQDEESMWEQAEKALRGVVDDVMKHYHEIDTAQPSKGRWKFNELMKRTAGAMRPVYWRLRDEEIEQRVVLMQDGLKALVKGLQAVHLRTEGDYVAVLNYGLEALDAAGFAFHTENGEKQLPRELQAMIVGLTQESTDSADIGKETIVGAVIQVGNRCEEYRKNPSDEVGDLVVADLQKLNSVLLRLPERLEPEIYLREKLVNWMWRIYPILSLEGFEALGLGKLTRYLERWMVVDALSFLNG